MENQENDPIAAFDTLYTSNQMQMLKVILPYMQIEMQQFIAIYIKLNELIITMQFSQNPMNHFAAQDSKEFNMTDILKSMSPYLSDSEKEMMNQFSQMQENMEKFSQMSQMMQMMNDMGSSPESLLNNYLSEEQMAMFKMFEEDFS